jgi:Na+-transporting NADH:ubiquinone oxidoreductase subunit NqrC
VLVMISLAQCQYELGQLDKAREVLEIAEDSTNKVKDEKKSAVVKRMLYHTLGKVYSANSADKEKAKAAFKLAA